MKTIWLASFWNGFFYQIFGENAGSKIRVYSSFEDVKLDKFNQTELESPLVKGEDDTYEFTIFGEEYDGVEVLNGIQEDIKTMKSEIEELEEMEAYFKSL